MDRQNNNWKEKFKTSEFGDIFTICRKILLLLGIKQDTEKQNEQKQWVLPELLLDQDNHSKTTLDIISCNGYQQPLLPQHYTKRATHLGKTGSICV